MTGSLGGQSGGRHGGPESTVPPMSGPLLAIDLGEKRIGLALSDPTQTVAHPLATLHRRSGKRFPLQALRRHLDEHAPVGIVMGLPIAEDGTEDARAAAAREAGERIAEKTGLPIAYWDERMTTARALRAVRELGGRLRGRKADVDKLAATTLLQTYLDSRR
jgi:putative Holliday junction resolvase